MKLTVIPDLRFAIAVKGSSATMASEINDNLDRASEVNIELDIASAFVEPKILYLLEDALARAKSGEPSPKIRLVFGVSKRFTPPKAVDKMLRLNNLHRDNITVRVAKDNKF